MSYTLLKYLVSAGLIVLISEIARRSTMLGAIVASLPVISLLAIIWLYVDTGDVARIARLSREILVLVVPSLVLFAALPLLLERGIPFVASLLIGCALCAVAYPAVLWAMQRAGW